MKTIWTYIDQKDWTARSKYQLVLLVMQILSGLTGFAVWLVIRRWTLSTWDWMYCFIGYPVIVSWLIVFFYSCRHEFHNGKHLPKNNQDFCAE